MTKKKSRERLESQDDAPVSVPTEPTPEPEPEPEPKPEDNGTTTAPPEQTPLPADGKAKTQPIPPVDTPPEEETVGEAPKRPDVPAPKPSTQNMIETLQSLEIMKKEIAKLVNLGVVLPKSLVENTNELWVSARSDLGMK